MRAQLVSAAVLPKFEQSTRGPESLEQIRLDAERAMTIIGAVLSRASWRCRAPVVSGRHTSFEVAGLERGLCDATQGTRDARRANVARGAAGHGGESRHVLAQRSRSEVYAVYSLNDHSVLPALRRPMRARYTLKSAARVSRVGQAVSRRDVR